MKARHSSLWCLAVVLLATAVILARSRWRADATSSLGGDLSLAQLLPASVRGAFAEDLPLGSNEFVDQKAREILDYDDMVFRAYATPSGSFAVYVGHWRAGRFSPSFIAAHTPDRCWTLAGMKCLGYKSDYTLSGGDTLLPGGQWRRFAAQNGQVVHVVFWHLVGNQQHDYGSGFHSFTDPFRRVKDVVGDLFLPHGAQYFIRLSSDRPLEELRREPVFQEVLEALVQLGLADRKRDGRSDPQDK